MKFPYIGKSGLRVSPIWVSLFLLLSGCSVKQYAKSETIIVTLKTKPLKFSDQAYLRHDNESVELELFSAGVAVEKFNIENKICVNAGCISKEGFNEKYLSRYYEEDILKEVLLGKAIFKGKNLVKKDDGFEQRIQKFGKYDIIYKVKQKSVYFKDRWNHLLIKIKF